MHTSYILKDSSLCIGPYPTYTEADDQRNRMYKLRCEAQKVPYIAPVGLPANMFNTKYKAARKIYEAIEVHELQSPDECFA